MSFVAAGTAATTTIRNDGWWPDISTRHFADTSRLDGTVSPARLEWALGNAMLDVNRQLAFWKLQQYSYSVKRLQDVPTSEINGVSRLMMLYQQAIYSEARARLTEHYRDFDTTTDGDKRAKSLEPQIHAYRRESQLAIADLTGADHLTVELI